MTSCPRVARQAPRHTSNPRISGDVTIIYTSRRGGAGRDCLPPTRPALFTALFMRSLWVADLSTCAMHNFALSHRWAKQLDSLIIFTNTTELKHKYPSRSLRLLLKPAGVRTGPRSVLATGYLALLPALKHDIQHQRPRNLYELR